MPSTIGHAGWRAGSPTAARESIDPRTTVGPVHLTVRDLDRAVEFYEQQLGLRVRERREGGAWLGAGGPDLLVLGGSPGAPRARRTTGLYHFALLVPTRRDLA